jgi:hypothetical protein
VAAKGPHGEGKSGAGGEKLDKNRKKEVKHRQNMALMFELARWASEDFFFPAKYWRLWFDGSVSLKNRSFLNDAVRISALRVRL